MNDRAGSQRGRMRRKQPSRAAPVATLTGALHHHEREISRAGYCLSEPEQYNPTIPN